jgi:chitin disaccharide deacetylase
VHTHPEYLPHFKETAEACRVPLRGCSCVRYCSSFYGQWAGEHHPEQVSVAGLTRILGIEVGEGITELGCHPGYADPDLVSSYTGERELELSTLCDDRVRSFLDEHGITLIGFDEVSRLVCMST